MIAKLFLVLEVEFFFIGCVGADPRSAHAMTLGDFDFVEFLGDLDGLHGDLSPVLRLEIFAHVESGGFDPSPVHAEAICFDPIVAFFPRGNGEIDGLIDLFEGEDDECGDIF